MYLYSVTTQQFRADGEDAIITTVVIMLQRREIKSHIAHTQMYVIVICLAYLNQARKIN